MADIHKLAKRVGAAVGDDARIPPKKIVELQRELAALGGSERENALGGILALAVEAKKGGPAANKLIEDLCEVAAAAFRGKDEAATAFDKAGLGDFAAATGKASEARAPREEPKAAPTVQAKRGLKK